MKIGVLTSSRADFGIYAPLLKKIAKDPFFKLEVIAFGTHLSEKHGYTLSEIETYRFKIIHKIATVPESDLPLAIAESMASTSAKFARF